MTCKDRPTLEGTISMNEYINLSPGTAVPMSGEYKCVCCAMRTVVANGGAPTVQSIRQNVFSAERGTVQFFEKGTQFAQCPACGPATGWTLIGSQRDTDDRASLSHSIDLTWGGHEVDVLFIALSDDGAARRNYRLLRDFADLLSTADSSVFVIRGLLRSDNSTDPIVGIVYRNGFGEGYWFKKVVEKFELKKHDLIQMLWNRPPSDLDSSQSPLAVYEHEYFGSEAQEDGKTGHPLAPASSSEKLPSQFLLFGEGEKTGPI